jgi:hypothetical protein
MYFNLFEWGSNGVESLLFLELDFLFFRLRRILELDRWPTVGGLYFKWRLVACGGSIEDNGSAFFSSRNVACLICNLGRSAAAAVATRGQYPSWWLYFRAVGVG